MIHIGKDIHIGLPITGIVAQGNSLSNYAMWWLSASGYEIISRQAAPAAGHDTSFPTIDTNGNLVTYGVDDYAKSQDGQRDLTFGGFTVLNGMSNDISDPYWNKISTVTYDTYWFKGAATGQGIFVTLPTTLGVDCTISFYAYVEAGGQITSLYKIRHVGVAGDLTVVPLTYIRKRHFLTVTGDGGTVQFGVQDYNTSNWAKVYIDTINITETPYAMPPVVNTTSGALIVGARYGSYNSGDPYGPRVQITPDVIGGAYTGPADGVELVTNGVFSGGIPPTGWSVVGTVNATNYVSENENGIRLVCDGTYIGLQQSSISFESGATYEYELDIYSTSGSGIYIKDTSASFYKTFNSSGIKTGRVISGGGALQINRSGITDTVIKSISFKQVSRNMGAPKLLDALDGKADGVELVTTNANFSAWTADDPDNYTTSNEDANNYITEHVSGARIVSNNTSVLLLIRTLSLSEGKYEWVIIKSNQLNGFIRCKVRNYTAGSDIVTSFNIPGSDNNGEFSVRFNSPAGTNTIELYLYRDNQGAGLTDYVINSWSLKQISPAQGHIEIPWKPLFSAAEATANVNILGFNNTASGSGLYYDYAAQKLKLTDGTNTAEIACVPVSGTQYSIVLDHGDTSGQKMRISLDGTPGTAVTNANRFPYVSHLMKSYENAYPQEIGTIKIKRNPQW